MKTRKSGLLQRLTAVLLAAVLVVGMAWDAAPNTVLAQEDAASSVSDGRQESTEGNTEEPAEGNTKPEEKAPAPAGTTNPEEPKPETPKPDEEPKQETPVPEEEPKPETPKPDGETAEQENVSGNDAQPEIVAAPQSVMMAAEPVVQAELPYEGDDWEIDADGKLTISSEQGMNNWRDSGRKTYGQNILKAEILEGVTYIWTGMFSGCSNLKEITLPAGVTQIQEFAFQNCSSLTEITLPASVTSIDSRAFQGCSSLTEITLPASVMVIGDRAFADCISLTEVNMKGEEPPLLQGDVFANCGFVTGNKQGIDVPEGKAQTYKDKWTKWAAYIADDTPTPPVEKHEHNDVTFTAWTKADSLPTDAGNYYLTKDVTLSDTWHLPGGGETTTLCLNGKTISNNSNMMVIYIGSSSTLHLYDCQNTGNITGGKSGGVFSKGTFHMYGGKISGNTAVGSGGGVAVNGGTFQMDGGEISGNTAAHSGGGVYVSGTFAVGGGAVVSGNTSNGTENNVYLSYELIELDSSNPLSGSAKIGVTTYAAPTEGSPVDITGHNKGDYSSHFTSDNPTYEIVNTDDVVQLVVKSQSHTHNLTLTPAKPATCTEDGNAAYYTCDGCDKWFLDAAGTQEITDKTSVVIAKKGHDYDETAWGYRAAEGHAHKCKNCDAHDTVQPRTPGAAATESTPQTCTVCGYIIAPATGAEPGNVTPEVKPGENAPETNISTPAGELREMLLTDDEKQQVQNGTDVKIILEVKDAGSTVSNSDKAAIQQVLNGFTVGQYLNIDLYKLIDGDRTDMHETAEKIRIVINVPDSLKNTDSKKTRTFAVIRVHNGNAELLTDLDNNADTITIETDRFSTYAIVYKDTANGGSGGGNGGSGNDNNGGDNGSGGDNNGGSDNGNGSAYNNGGSSNSDAGSNNNGGTGSGVGSAKNSSQNNAEKITVKQGSSKDDEPKTGDNTPLELSATLAMIAGFAYLLLYFADRERGMTEETKKELVSRLVGWAKQGGRFRKYLALAAIFVLLVYYHSIGKKTCVIYI